MYTGQTVIDLTGAKHDTPDIEAQDDISKNDFATTLSKYDTGERASILHLYIKDFSVPDWDKTLWKPLAKDITKILKSGRDVLVACSGGHGRTGVAISILAHLIDPELVGESPIEWLRKLYCKKVVENQKQIDYIYEVLGLGEPPKELKPAKVPVVSYQTSSPGFAGSLTPSYTPKESYWKGSAHNPPLSSGAYQNVGGITVPVHGGIDTITDEEWGSLMDENFG